ncbi:hypothetical protein HOY82DRAFT_558233, partial [Tuber indicum]
MTTGATRRMTVDATRRMATEATRRVTAEATRRMTTDGARRVAMDGAGTVRGLSGSPCISGRARRRRTTRRTISTRNITKMSTRRRTRRAKSARRMIRRNMNVTRMLIPIARITRSRRTRKPLKWAMALTRESSTTRATGMPGLINPNARSAMTIPNTSIRRRIMTTTKIPANTSTAMTPSPPKRRRTMRPRRIITRARAINPSMVLSGRCLPLPASAGGRGFLRV